jgi:hypothetical protein
MPRKQVFEWPIWAEAYAFGVAIPLAFASFGLMIWLIRNQTAVLDSEFIGAILLMIAFIASFLMSGVLFASCAERVWHQKSDALSFASSAHMMSILPAAFILMIGFVRENELFLNGLADFMRTGQWNIDAIMLAWVLFHTPFMTLLSLADNTNRFADNGNSDED